MASPASGHVGTCPPPWRLRENNFSARLYVVWFGMVLCKSLNLEYICSAVFVLEWNDTITGYNGALFLPRDAMH